MVITIIGIDLITDGITGITDHIMAMEASVGTMALALRFGANLIILITIIHITVTLQLTLITDKAITIETATEEGWHIIMEDEETLEWQVQIEPLDA
jgi:hypothetical protein